MPELERSEALAVFIESGGHRCRIVARTFFQGEDAKDGGEGLEGDAGNS